MDLKTSLWHALTVNCHPDWIPLFKTEEFMKVIMRLAEIPSFSPQISRVLRPFQRPKSSVKLIILGQDPYPFNATGYAFANEIVDFKKSYNPSLLNILASTGCKDHTLESWVVQGVMLLNTHMTITPNKGAISTPHPFWADWTKLVIKDLKVPVLCWGQIAQKLAMEIGCQMLKWSHPNPNADDQVDESRKFRNCTNFADVNKLLAEPIIWNTNRLDVKPDYFVVTDGACTSNGKLGARAAWAYIIYDREGKPIANKAELVQGAQTNNVAELTAIIRGLNNMTTIMSERSELKIYESPHHFIVQRSASVVLLTDSMYALGLLAGNNANVNVELVEEMRGLYKAVDPIMMHIKGHQTYSSDEHYTVKMNRLVDELATECLKIS